MWCMDNLLCHAAHCTELQPGVNRSCSSHLALPRRRASEMAPWESGCVSLVYTARIQLTPRHIIR